MVDAMQGGFRGSLATAMGKGCSGPHTHRDGLAPVAHCWESCTACAGDRARPCYAEHKVPAPPPRWWVLYWEAAVALALVLAEVVLVVVFVVLVVLVLLALIVGVAYAARLGWNLAGG